MAILQHSTPNTQHLTPNTQSLIPILFIILDGLADRPQTVLGGKTPLEAAWTPHLDRLAEVGTNGLLVPFAPGVPLESEFAHFLLFGYPAEKFRGAPRLKRSVAASLLPQTPWCCWRALPRRRLSTAKFGETQSSGKRNTREMKKIAGNSASR